MCEQSYEKATKAYFYVLECWFNNICQSLEVKQRLKDKLNMSKGNFFQSFDPF